MHRMLMPHQHTMLILGRGPKHLPSWKAHAMCLCCLPTQLGNIWQGEKVAPEHKEMVSVYFSDIVGFTTISSTISSAKVQPEARCLTLLGC